MAPQTLNITIPGPEVVSPLWVGRGLLPTLPEILQTTRYSQVLVVGDRGAAQIVERITLSLGCANSRTHMLKGGEDCKSLACVEELWSFFAKAKLDRRGLVVGVGGGAISDLVGFAAATFMRGVAFAAVPTTLLAHVDAGIGGKTGINFGGVKNLVGVITQPVGIIIDIDTLQSLPEREIRSGFAEIAKHGLIADRAYFERVTSRNCADWSADELVDIVFRSCQIKCSIVESDIFENGPRRAVNFGHTLGHAVEAHALHTESPLTHGEAIAIGINAACFISHRVGLLSREDQQRSMAGIAQIGLPLTLSQKVAPEKLLEFLALDKKNVGGVSRWTLLEAIGAVVTDQQVPDGVVLEAIAHIQPQGT